MKKIVITPLLICILCSGCMKNISLMEEELAPVTLYPTISDEKTKALIDDANIENETIRVNVAKSDGITSYATPDEAKYTLTNGGESWALSSTLYLSADNAKIYAYSPCPADPTTVEIGSYSTLQRKLDIPSTQSMVDQVDYLWGSQDKTIYGGVVNINSSNPGVQLKMHHALSQIAFVFYKDNYAGTGAISSIKIKDNSGTPSLITNKSVDNDLVLNIANGSIAGGEAVAEITLTPVGSVISLTADPLTDPETLKGLINAYSLVVPTTIADKTNIQFTFTIDSNDYVVSLPGPGSISWLAGQQYIYKVRLSGTQTVLESVTVSSWASNYEGEVIIF